MLQTITITDFISENGTHYPSLQLSYQLFGKPLHTSSIAMINHALTGNSDVAGEKGWWKTLVGEGKVIDLEQYTVLCFNIIGNGYDGFFVDDYKNLTAKDMALCFLFGLKFLNINHLDVLIGGSVGGSLAWEMLSLAPDLATKFIPVATDYKTTDWLHSQCLVQSFLLESSENPIEKARIHAMLNYRTPQSIDQRFQREIDTEKQILKSHDWLNYHGNALKNRFSLEAYCLVNQLLMTIDVREEALLKINAEIHFIAVKGDLHFPDFHIKETYRFLLENEESKSRNKVFYHEIDSIHGHDAFLMEYNQLNEILKPILSFDEKNN